MSDVFNVVKKVMKAVDNNVNNMPSWKHRRRLVYIGFFTGLLMIVFAGVTFFFDTGVSNQMVIGGVALISIVLTSYTAMATYEDVKLWNNNNKGEIDEYSD